MVVQRALVAVLVLVASVARADDGVRAAATSPPPRHLIYVEALGKGGLYGVGYERALLPWLAVGGAGSWSALRGQHVLTLAPYAHVTVARRHHHALFGELGAIYARSSIASHVSDWNGMTSDGAGGFATLGYEHASRHLVLRGSGGIAAGRGGVQPMIGLAIGWRP